MEQILEILEKDSRITPQQIAVMLDKDPAAVAAAIQSYEKDKTIVGYKTLVNWEKTLKESVTAFIELKVTPQFGEGFDKIAKKIYQHDCVKSVYLMSGGFDLAVTIEGRTLKEVSLFVSEKPWRPWTVSSVRRRILCSKSTRTTASYFHTSPRTKEG